MSNPSDSLREQILDPKFQERFWKKVEKTDGCWLWTGGISGGYGCIGIEGRSHLAHRISYTMANGLIAPKMVCDHLCRNRACVNPAHIEIVTNRENVLRGEGISAKWSKRDTCEKGHPYSGENLYLYKGNIRQCRKCRVDQQRARRKKPSALKEAL